MKRVTVQQAEMQLGQLLAEASRGEVVVVTNGDIEVTLTPRDSSGLIDPEVDSPQLEAELLKAIDGPYTPYSPKELDAICERVIGEKRRK